MLVIHASNVGAASGEVEVRQVFEIEDFPVSAAEKPDAAALKFFETKIRPLRPEKCSECHGAK